MKIDLTDLQTLHYDIENPGEEGIAIVTLDRAETRNAQNRRMTYEMNACYDDASHRSDVKVIVLQADGPHFCSGHDNGDREPLDTYDPVFPTADFHLDGQEGNMALEEEVYMQMTWRWRNLPKPVIAAAQGKTIAGGLPLLWAADIIIAAENAAFSDPVVSFGVNGVEYFGHPWELGPRKAKEMLFTGDWVTAQQAHQLGMVNHVVPAEQLREFTMTMARRIAERPSFALKLAKEGVNQALEAQGQWTAMRAAFSLQHIAHAHNKLKYGMPALPGARKKVPPQ
jgi:enoyl-CoA hydratase